jgi:hypothetical protein
MQANPGPRLGDMIDLKLLVLCPHRRDPNCTALCRIMDYIGMKYDVLATSEANLSEDRLWQGTHARYQGIVLSTGYFAQWNTALSDWYDPLDDEEWNALHAFQARFGIRVASFCGVPRVFATTNALMIHEPASTQETPLELTLTDAGRQVFAYLNGDCRIPVLAGTAIAVTPMTIASAPLLEGADGQTYGALWTTKEGCEYLSLTLEHSERSLHTLLLAYGVLNWVTRGVFLGQRKVTLGVQIDDIFTSNQLWNGASGSAAAASVYRMTAADVAALAHWQDRVQKQRNAQSMTVSFAFNGAAATPVPADKTALEAFLANKQRFYWINHGYTHLWLDNAGHVESLQEIQRNQDAARLLDLMPYEPDCMVTADMSGLTNPDFLSAAAQSGIRYLVCDTSRPGWNNPTANTPILSDVVRSVTILPRHPNNLFYDVATPSAWVEQYNATYQAVWGRDLSIAEVIKAEATQLVEYLLVADWDPLMFHQANLRAYDDTHSLLTDLLDEVLGIYNQYCGDVPICCLSMRTIGDMMTKRAAYNGARIDASLIVGNGLVLVADRDVETPLTGVRIHGSSEQYGGQTIATLSLKANVVRSLPAADLVGYSAKAM